ncbi:urate hydroxylase PuuD [Paremcibacter congregatus]|uniref:Cytochrome c domain-containing protein n=1 Tax=Paremcibacter congregatus TaxID=2043170 RepID=A0A2G4YSH0_9PROT|nr:urate hydroxylase PuuD [Paremcibacter congregatus]PHZ85275.1 hypothetical protein CRD36_07680 [Paremcibacter congregatus]QDE27793.1 hypothetical protein FIV45_11155 [Paremcibacter congregatus]
MELDITSWLSMAIRWLHLITGIAWIGSSFYFIWLDNHLRKAKDEVDTAKGVSGELWAVHGGGFYHKQKYSVAPPEMPGELHWFKWEAYFTWISGFLLLAVVYYYGASVFLVDASKYAMAPLTAVAIGIAFLIGGWLGYNLLCRSPLGQNNVAFGWVWFGLLTLSAWGLSQIFNDRGAYIHVGAMIGTVMAANVFMVIIPNQKKVVADLVAGKAPDPRLGQVAKQRSLHNNYMTLPVLFIMISNHYPQTFANPHGWLILAGIGAVGWVIRHFFNLKHRGETRYGLVVLAVAGYIGVMALAAYLRDQARSDVTVDANQVSFTQVQQIMDKHCVACHGTEATHELFDEAPNGVIFEAKDVILKYRDQILERAVVSQDMPLGNETGMTDEERATLAAWLKKTETD